MSLHNTTTPVADPGLLHSCRNPTVWDHFTSPHPRIHNQSNHDVKTKSTSDHNPQGGRIQECMNQPRDRSLRKE
jgi:hypothetical protein